MPKKEERRHEENEERERKSNQVVSGKISLSRNLGPKLAPEQEVTDAVRTGGEEFSQKEIMKLKEASSTVAVFYTETSLQNALLFSARENGRIREMFD